MNGKEDRESTTTNHDAAQREKKKIDGNFTFVVGAVVVFFRLFFFAFLVRRGLVRTNQCDPLIEGFVFLPSGQGLDGWLRDCCVVVMTVMVCLG